VLVLACACLCAAAAPQSAPPPRQTRMPFTAADGDRFASKYAAVVARGPAPAGVRRKPIQTIITEPEINGYLRYRSTLLPVGVLEPYLFALGDGRVAGVATVDLDAVRLSKPRGMLDPAQLLRGRVPGILRSKDGEFRFELESATVAGIEVPKSLLQELVGYYTRSATNPNGYNLDAPFTLQGGIQAVTVEAGRAIIIQ
jgi:hypothetical protein